MNSLLLSLILTVSLFCFEDTNQDGWVDEHDLEILLVHWGLVGFPDINGDVTGDGLRNMKDLVAILNGWGKCSTPEAVAQNHIWSMRWEGCTGESIWLSEFITVNYFRYWRLMVKCHRDWIPDTWHYILMESEIDWVGKRYRYYRPTDEWAFVEPRLVDQWYAVGSHYPECDCED